MTAYISLRFHEEPAYIKIRFIYQDGQHPIWALDRVYWLGFHPEAISLRYMPREKHPGFPEADSGTEPPEWDSG